jgi:hypothetical protein
LSQQTPQQQQLNIQITADGTVDIDSAGVLTLDSGAAINLEPAAGSAILLDGTISVDAGVVTGATSITSTTFVGALTGQADTVATISGLAPDTATTQATQASITTCANLVTVGALNSGSITSGFGNIDNGASTITTTGDITGGTVNATGDTAAADNAAMGYTATEGLILTGQGSTNDVTIKNDADETILGIPTGTNDVKFGVDGAEGALILAEKTSIQLDPAGGADGDYSGTTITGTGGATIAFGDTVYLAAGDSRWELTDASAVGTAGTVIVGIAVTSSTDGNPITVLMDGTIRADAKFPTLTIGGAVYLSETAGLVVTTAPTTADAVVKVVGYGLTANEMYFRASMDHITVTG